MKTLFTSKDPLETLNEAHDPEWTMQPSTSVQPSLTGDIPVQVKAFEEFTGKDGKKNKLIEVEPHDKPLEGQLKMFEEADHDTD